MLTLEELLVRHSSNGKLDWIGLRPARKAPVEIVQSVNILEKGLEGDRTTRPNDRSVTLIQSEHIPVIASICGIKSLSPEIFRRNLAVSGINLLALKGQKFQIGSAVLEGTGICAPCSKMETALGHGGYNAMRGHGGITAKVLMPGKASIGDDVKPL